MNEGATELIERGRTARREHRLGDARADFEAAQAIARGSRDDAALARALAGLAQVDRDGNDLHSAWARYHEAVEICRRLDGPLLLAHMVRHRADLDRELGKLTEANAGYDEVLSIYRSDAQARSLDLANALRGAALLHEALGDRTAEAQAWTEACELYRGENVDAGVTECERRIAALQSA